jgi:hypothetical protein
MRTVSYQDLERGVAEMIGWPVDELDSAEFHQIKRALSRELEFIWRDWYWPELTITERRQCADDYDSAATYAALAQVFHPGSNAYYVALRASTDEAPATLSGTATWTVNSSYWAQLARSYGATPFNSATTYAVGDQVTYAEDGATYQLHTAASAGTQPSNTSYWGRVPEFAPTVPWVHDGFTAIGDVAGVWVSNPGAFRGSVSVPWSRSPAGIAIFPVAGAEVPRPWVRYLQRPHRFTGDFYNNDTAYTATDAEDLTGTATALNMSDTSGIGYAGRASLRARTQHLDNQVAYLLYLVTSGDGQGGWFYFNATSATADDGVDVLRPDDIASTNLGRWIRNS